MLPELSKDTKKSAGEPRAIFPLVIEDTLKAGFDYGFTEVETAFLERLENLKELILPDSITEISMSEKLEKILKDNNTLIRGSLDSFAERFAADTGHNFRPADFIIARHVYEKVQETTLLTVQFKRDGKGGDHFLMGQAGENGKTVDFELFPLDKYEKTE